MINSPNFAINAIYCLIWKDIISNWIAMFRDELFIYKLAPRRSSFLPNPHHLSTMLSTADNAQQHFAVAAPPRQRQPTGLAGSIWAPQPQPSDKTWPNKLDSVSRSAERELDGLPRMDSRLASIVRDDIYGQQLPAQVPARNGPSSRDIGAIGDGRKRFSPSDYDDSVRFTSPFSVNGVDPDCMRS